MEGCLEYTARSLPHNLEAEKKVLGAMMRDVEARALGLELLSVEDFYEPSHAKIYQALQGMFLDKIDVDLITLSDYMEKQNTLTQVGGGYYLAEIAQSIATSTNISNHINIIKEKSTRRKIIRLCQGTIQSVYESNKEATEILGELHQQSIENSHKRGAVPIGLNPDEMIQVFEQRYERKRQKADSYDGLSCGISDLDRILNGWQPGLYIIAARPSVGKTTIGMQIMDGLSQFGKSIWYPYEGGGRRKLLERHVSRRTRLDLSKELEKKQVSRLINEIYDSEKSNILINDSMPTIAQIEAETYRLSLEHKIAAIGLDYLGIMNNKGIPGDRKYEWVPEITRRCMHISNSLQVPFIALQQLSRDSEKQNREPCLSDLRDSGAVEQDADVVIFLHRPPEKQAEDHEQKDNSGIIRVIVAKNRNGPLGKFDIFFDSSTFFFGNYYAGKNDEEIPF